MGFCGKCGGKMDSKYCPEDGWSASAKEDQARSIRSRDHYGPTATTQGEGSHIYFGSGDEITPPTTRTKEKRLVRMLWVKLVGVLGFVGSVASITGFTLGDIRLVGLFTYYKNLMDLSPTTSATAKPFGTQQSLGEFLSPSIIAVTISLAVLLVSMLLLVSAASLSGALRFRKYRFGRRGRILEENAGWLQRSTIIGVCPTCRGRLKLRKVVTGTKTIKGKDSDGHLTEKEKDVKELRLVCDNNGLDHRFKFDPALICASLEPTL